MNILMLDEERVIVERQDEPMIKALKGWGFKPILCNFRNFNSFGGSFHCATLDVRRRAHCSLISNDFSRSRAMKIWKYSAKDALMPLFSMAQLTVMVVMAAKWEHLPLAGRVGCFAILVFMMHVQHHCALLISSPTLHGFRRRP